MRPERGKVRSDLHELVGVPAFVALGCLPAFVWLIACGLALGDMTAAQAASSGALVVGFGVFQEDIRHPIVPMLLVCLGMSLSVAIAALAWKAGDGSRRGDANVLTMAEKIDADHGSATRSA